MLVIQSKIVILQQYSDSYANMRKDNLTIPVVVYDKNDPLLPTDDALLIEEAKKASRNSYAPYSQFHVGAALRLVDGTVVHGSNQENAVFPAGCCAERTALYYAGTTHPSTAVDAIAVAVWREKDGLYLAEPASPCGVCRQHLVETEMRHGRKIKVILYGTEHTYVLQSAQDLLPLTFTADVL